MTSEKNEFQKEPLTFTVIVDDKVAAYIEQENITDTNAYMNKLLREEKDRRQRSDHEFDEQDMNELIEETPDTSGYPQMEGHFRQSG